MSIRSRRTEIERHPCIEWRQCRLLVRKHHCCSAELSSNPWEPPLVCRSLLDSTTQGFRTGGDWNFLVGSTSLRYTPYTTKHSVGPGTFLRHMPRIRDLGWHCHYC
eukprot:scaffold1552_cov165-Pinguiococcus_pyrenoidosus.AAC.2